MSDAFEWEAPPERRHGGPQNRSYGLAVAQVRERPGEWLRAVSGPLRASQAYSARSALSRRFAGDEHFECVVRRLEAEGADGGPQYGVWLRYRTPEQMRPARRSKKAES